jgi:hypothetical protein
MPASSGLAMEGIARPAVDAIFPTMCGRARLSWTLPNDRGEGLYRGSTPRLSTAWNRLGGAVVRILDLHLHNQAICVGKCAISALGALVDDGYRSDGRCPSWHAVDCFRLPPKLDTARDRHCVFVGRFVRRTGGERPGANRLGSDECRAEPAIRGKSTAAAAAACISRAILPAERFFQRIRRSLTAILPSLSVVQVTLVRDLLRSRRRVN